jgi:hypothetical protein
LRQQEGTHLREMSKKDEVIRSNAFEIEQKHQVILRYERIVKTKDERIEELERENTFNREKLLSLSKAI